MTPNLSKCQSRGTGLSRTAALPRPAKTWLRFVAASSLALALAAFALVNGAMAASIEGSWRGGGTVRLKTGEVEKVRCRIRYEKSTGRTVIVYVNCSHANGTFSVSGRIVKLSASHYSGSLYSDQYAVSGDVSVRVTGNKQRITAKSAKGTATVSLTRQ